MYTFKEPVIGPAQSWQTRITCDPIDPPYQSSIPMPRCRQAFAIAVILFATPSAANPANDSRQLLHVGNSRSVILAANVDKPQDPDTDVLALPTGKCSKLKVAGRDFACRAVAFFQNEH